MFIDLCARAIYYKSMKKIAALVLIVVLGVVLVQGCVDKNDDVKKVADYFRNYSSSGAYTKAEKKLELELGQHFSSYDAASGVFVITEDIELADGETSVTRYGLASESEVYIEPKYGFASVMDIRGDYALVLTSVLENGEEVSYIGVMPFRGAHALKEYPYLNPNYRFRYEYTSPLIQQMTLLDNDYLVVLGALDELSQTGPYSFATVYRYSSGNGYLMYAEIPYCENYSTFQLVDGYLVATHRSGVDFYDFKNIGSNGSLTKIASVSNLISGAQYEVTNMASSTYYLGGDWFIVSTQYVSTEQFDGYEFTVSSGSDGISYVKMNSVKISMNSKKQFPTERVTMVSNKYTDSAVRSITDAVNAEDVYNAALWKTAYTVPVAPSSAFINDGYSIVYYKYYYYPDPESNERSWTDSFQIYDSHGEGVVASNLQMPTLFTDGKGVQNADPNFDIPLMSAGYNTYEDGTFVTLSAMSEKTGFNNAFIHGGVLIAYRNIIDESIGFSTNIGAINVDTGEIVADFDYDSFSPFFGGYATASKVAEFASDGSVASQAFYRIGADGSETPIPDCYQMRNGCYITRAGEGANARFGLKSNDGKELLSASFKSVSTFDYMYANGKVFSKCYAAAINEYGRGILYVLS